MLIALEMTWDGPYSCAEEQLRPSAGEAAEALGAWAQLCTARQVRRQGCCTPGHKLWAR